MMDKNLKDLYVKILKHGYQVYETHYRDVIDLISPFEMAALISRYVLSPGKCVHKVMVKKNRSGFKKRR